MGAVYRFPAPRGIALRVPAFAGSNDRLSWGHGVLKWLLVVVMMVLVTGLFRPGLTRLRFGHLPGDLHFRVLGRPFHLPFTSTILLSLLAWAVLRVL